MRCPECEGEEILGCDFCGGSKVVVEPAKKVTTTKGIALGRHNIELATMIDGPSFKTGALYQITAIEILPTNKDICIYGHFKGYKCDCALCRHDDNICIAHESGSGCDVCDGPVCGCDLYATENKGTR